MLITIIAAAVLASGVPAATETATPQPAPKAADATPNPRVCLVDNVTGSRIPVRTCKRLAEWRAAGLDPFAKR